MLILIMLVLVPPSVVFAQDSQPKLQLRLIRKFGYGGFGKIQGRFMLKIDNPPEDLDKIEYYLDDEMIATVFDPPYEFHFHTSYFKDGEHTFSAIVYLMDGALLDTNSITKIFLSADQAWSDTQRLIVPLLLITAGLTFLGLGIPLLLGKKRSFVIGTYGPAGGVVCPRCQYPFSRSVFAPNLVVGKLVRCPHCGKISVLARASSQLLQEAENRYKNLDPDLRKKEVDLEFNRMLDDSRFED